jgi:hypothetical protein
VELLLKHPRINVNAKSKIMRGSFALIDATKNNHPGVVEALLKHPKTDVAAEDDRGRIALAAARRNTETLRLLSAHSLCMGGTQ